MSDLIGRDNEIKRLEKVISEKEAQLVIVYRRLRVGKTYLVNEFFENKFTFKFSLDDETSCDYADLPDGNDFDFPEDFINATDLPF
jgi:AAA+ ATPase superfamily predicted ATPase